MSHDWFKMLDEPFTLTGVISTILLVCWVWHRNEVGVSPSGAIGVSSDSTANVGRTV